MVRPKYWINNNSTALVLLIHFGEERTLSTRVGRKMAGKDLELGVAAKV